MKFALAALALVAAVAALVFRPPLAPTAGISESRGADGALARGSAATAPAAPAASPGPCETVGRPPADCSSRAGSGKAGGSGRTVRRAIVVYVAGEVVRPGVYTFAPDERAESALVRAGGPKSDADLVAVILAAPLTDGEEVAFPKIGEPAARLSRPRAPRPHASHRPRRRRRERATDASVAPAEPLLRAVDLNLADAAELEALPGIGPALAARIVEYRDENGPFTSLDELADVSGITPALQEKIGEYLTVR